MVVKHPPRPAKDPKDRGPKRATDRPRDPAAIVIRPDVKQLFAEAARQYGAGRLAETVAAYRMAIALQPGIAEVHVNLASALKELGQLEEAIASYRSAIALRPNLAEAHYNLGVVLQQRGRRDEAMDAYRRARAFKPSLLEAHCNLGNLLRELGRNAEAAASYRAGLDIAPSDAELLNNLARVLEYDDRWGEAVGLYRKALAIKPGFAKALGNLTRVRKLTCDWDGLAQQEEQCRAVVRSGGAGIDTLLLQMLPATPAELLAAARLETAVRTAGARPLPPRPPQPRQKLRLGYLSEDLRAHNVSFLTAELFERHDRGRFEVSAYSFGPDDDSSLRRRLVETFDRFVDIRALSHADAAAKIREDGIDILVDLNGHTGSPRTAILASRPAPIQVNFVGYLCTMGAKFIDYVIADPIALPMTDQPFYDERIVHLPDCCQPSDTRRPAAATSPSRAACGLPEAGAVFGCFNDGEKITPQVFDVWMQLLRAVPASVLWLLDKRPEMRANLLREAAARGVAADRLVFAPMLERPDHLARYALVDLFLDTLPCNAHTTMSDALGGGVPVLTCAGDTFAGRIAASMLHAIGLPDLVAASLEQYEALAVRLGAEPDRLRDVRRRLAANRPAAPLFDMARYARHLEAAYLRMWEICAAGRPPEAFAVAR
jgi:protein O-GlcNAc transferase